MFGIFGKKKKYAELSEKAKRLAQERVRESREERLKEEGLLYAFRERAARDRRSGKDRRHRQLPVSEDRRQCADRRSRIDRRDSIRAACASQPGSLASRKLMLEREREHRLEAERDAIPRKPDIGVMASVTLP